MDSAYFARGFALKAVVAMRDTGKERAVKHVFIINPAAGQGRAWADHLSDIHRAAKAAGVEYEIHRSLSGEEIISYTAAQARSGGPIRFYACGGDGTLNNVLNGMIDYVNAELAQIPCGTGNDFVRNFTETKAFLDIGRQIAGTAIPMDVIRYTAAGASGQVERNLTVAGAEACSRTESRARYALNMFNIGLDCDVVAEAARLKEKPLLTGTVAYAVAALKILARGKAYHMAMKFEDEIHREETFFLVAVANGHFCGGGFQSAPRASLNDGKMDLCVVKPIHGPRMLSLLLKYRKGTHLDAPGREKYIQYLQCRKFSLYEREPVRISTDGEVSRFRDMEFEVVPGAVNFVLPEGVGMI